MKFLADNVWVWAGTGLVLITLSGQTRKTGIILTIAAISIHAIATITNKEN
jgi:hypothetical protein